jgi:GT2 family glycosyltransferase
MTVESSPAARRSSADAQVAIVVLNWNGRPDTLACLDSLRHLAYGNVDVIVVDNGSTDGSVTAIRQHHPEAHLVETGRNLGFAGGNNAGILEALARDARYVFLLNNDTIVAADCIRALVAAARNLPDAAALSPRIYYQSDPGRIWYTGSRWVPERVRFEHTGFGGSDTGGTTEISHTQFACGCAMLVPAEVLARVGLFDERFFLVFEETDWCSRARAMGLRCFVVPAARVWHRVSVSFGGAWSPLYRYFYQRNELLWAEQHLGWRDWLRLWRREFRDLAEPLPDLAAGAREALAGGHVKGAYWELATRWRAAYTADRVAERIAVRRALRDYLFRRFGDSPRASGNSANNSARDRPAPGSP